ncbi:hypothetical protein OEZ85_011391 [Tetradesmus obliquus]|uniref:DUF642 domain-containing protein n=1 Tax=Tetradesmus obliquus TaxID=3088 RepID=A0ABY8TSF9_TETOB|nr:hypothetical protein OEZ85_011391 [Tetradesmus obliquus]
MASRRNTLIALLLGAQLLLCAQTCLADRRSTQDDGEVQIFELSGPVGPQDLPEARLKAPASGWKLAGYDAVEGTPVVDTSRGVLEVLINHKPIKGVTPAMVSWMYSNLHKTVKLPASLASTYGTTLSPMFMLLHPVDHISVAIDSASSSDGLITPGTNVNWMEMPAAGCSWTGERASLWSCPASRSGYTSSTSPSEYAGRFYTKTTNTVIHNDASSFKTLKTVDSQLGPLTTSFSGHNWSFENGVLRPSSTYRIGLVERGGDGEYYLDMQRRFLSIINGRIETAFVNGEPNSARAQGYALLLHSIQEWQRLPQWLPAVYAANVKGGSRRMMH